VVLRDLHSFPTRRSSDLKEVIARRPPRTGSYCVVALSRVLASMGTVPEAMEIKRPVKDKKLSPALTLGVPAEWCRLSRIWYDRRSEEHTSELQSPCNLVC